MLRPRPHEYIITGYTATEENKYRHTEWQQGRSKNSLMTRGSPRKASREGAAWLPISSECPALLKLSAEARGWLGQGSEGL